MHAGGDAPAVHHEGDGGNERDQRNGGDGSTRFTTGARPSASTTPMHCTSWPMLPGVSAQAVSGSADGAGLGANGEGEDTEIG